MASLINEQTQYQDASGNPIVNGFIHIGVQNQDPTLAINKIIIYSDRDLTIPIANPQRTDSFGRSINKIWIPGRFSIVVHNVDGVQKCIDLDAGESPSTGITGLTNVAGANTITADASPTITVLVDKEIYVFTSIGTNTGAVTLAIDLVAAKAVLKLHDQPLIAGELEINQAVSVMYNGTDDTFELISSTLDPQIQSITATVASSALTLGLNPTSQYFRSTPLTDGTPNVRSNAALSLVVPSTATLGTTDAVESRLILLAIDNSSTVELAVVNNETLTLDETGLITTIAIDATADSADVFYSTTARTSVPYRVVGFVESTQSTAGTWDTSPTVIQGAGGESLSSPVLISVNAIKFPAIQIPNSDVNTFDDYEEGNDTTSWTPGIEFGGGTTGITYSAQVGFYTKIGNIVFASCTVILTNKGSSTGNAHITGLPFTPLSATAGQYQFSVSWQILATTWVNIMAFLRADTDLLLKGTTAAATNNVVILQDTDFGNTSIIKCSFFFIV